MTFFNFPFSTCETCKSIGHVVQPVQPWYTLVNAISTIILIVAATVAHHVPIKIVLSSFALFEAWHTFSHFKHLHNINNHQTNVVHVLSYGMSFASLYAILTLSKSQMTAWNIWVLIALIGIDLYAWILIKGIWPVFTSLGILLLLLQVNTLNYQVGFKLGCRICLEALYVSLDCSQMKW